MGTEHSHVVLEAVCLEGIWEGELAVSASVDIFSYTSKTLRFENIGICTKKAGYPH